MTRYEYKVLTQKDKWFSGKFDPVKLEEAINSYAQQGWRVISCATATIPGFGTTREEFITVMEREV
jgi:type II secretory pathway component PulF